MTTVGYVVASLAAESINRTLARALVRVAPEGLEMVEIPITDLPLYDRDLEHDFPPAARALKDAIEGFDGLLFVTPEHNRSIPAVLKNALDWASRPWGTNSLAGRPSAVIGASPGPLGTAAAQQHMRAILGYLDSPQMGQPEGYIQVRPGLVTPDGEVTDPATAEFLAGWMRAFAGHVTRNTERVAA